MLNQIFVRRAEREGGVPEARNIQPIYNPLFAPVVETFRTLSARPGLMFIALMIALATFLAGRITVSPGGATPAGPTAHRGGLAAPALNR